MTNDEVERTVHGTVPVVDEEGTEGSKEIDFTFSEVGQSELTVTYKMNDEEVKTLNVTWSRHSLSPATAWY